MAFVYLIAMSVMICGIFNNESQNFYLAASVMLSDEMEFVLLKYLRINYFVHLKGGNNDVC